MESNDMQVFADLGYTHRLYAVATYVSIVAVFGGVSSISPCNCDHRRPRLRQSTLVHVPLRLCCLCCLSASLPLCLSVPASLPLPLCLSASASACSEQAAIHNRVDHTSCGLTCPPTPPDYEYISLSTMMLAGGLVWAYVLSSLCGIFSSLNPHEAAYKNQMVRSAKAPT